VLTLLSDDAEDQAEALSGALRSRLREKPGVVLDETTMNLATFLAAMACSERPDPLCLLKIGDQLKVQRFVWGSLKKGPESGQVTADVHLWRRGKADRVAAETFSDNLRDQNDDVLRRIAGRLIDKLVGAPLAAAVTIRVGDASGELVIDGKDRVSIEHGEATVELRPGHHVLEVRSDGYRTVVQPVDVVESTDQVLDVRLVPQEAERPAEPSKPIAARTVLALGLVAVGAGFGVAGTVKAAQFLSLRSENQRDHETLDAANFCDPNQAHKADLGAMQEACDRIKRGEDARNLEFVFYGIAAAAAGAGIVLLITDTPDARASDARARAKPRLSPTLLRGGGGADFSMRF
jgi:hypothetical protein